MKACCEVGRQLKINALMEKVYGCFQEHYLSKYVDADVDYFAKFFDEPLNSKILEVGANQEPIANILSLVGYDVVGVDLRPYLEEKRCGLPLNFRFIEGDFNDLEFEEEFDVVVSTSTMEHLGLGAYGEEPYPNGDVLAMMKCWDLLREGGHAYITVPIGVYMLYERSWRMYGRKALNWRIIQDFKVLKHVCFASGMIKGHMIGKSLDEETAFRQVTPDATVLLILEKRSSLIAFTKKV